LKATILRGLTATCPQPLSAVGWTRVARVIPLDASMTRLSASATESMTLLSASMNDARVSERGTLAWDEASALVSDE
jgi:hypothetical protein